jgi:hypothetical protein
MGCCCSNDSSPDCPDVIKPDPPTSTSSPITVDIAALGSWGTGHDYGIWENQRPSSNDEANKTVWLWFNKTANDKQHNGETTVRLENFVRTDASDPKLGKILYNCFLQKKPSVSFFQRYNGQSSDSFLGFLTGRPPSSSRGDATYSSFHTSQSYDDGYYMNHESHRYGGHGLQHVTHKATIVTKWQSYNSAKIHDGNLGRGEAFLGKNNVLLDVLALGTTVTTYLTIREEVERRDAEGHVSRHMETRHDHHTNTFVDSVQYRVTVNNLLWSEWSIPGDNGTNSATNVVVSTPFFNTTLEGGWCKRTKYHTTTLNGIDPALAILLSHLICTEFSIPEIKNDLNLPIPSREPSFLQGAPSSLNYTLSPTSGVFTVV